MHGVIFTSLRDYLTATFGAQAARELVADEPVYLLSETYDDERLADLVRRAALLTGADEDAIVYDFGVYTALTTFARLYPAFFAIASSTCEFLLTVETRIHELVRATIPSAAPPRLTVTKIGDDAVEIRYASPRHLCVLLQGLAEGTARHYAETLQIEETTRMRRGDDACRLQVAFAAAAAA